MIFDQASGKARDGSAHGSTLVLGMGTTNCPPHSRMWAICSMTSSLMIPGKNQKIVWLRLADPLRPVDRHVHPRKEAVLLVRTPVHGVVQEIGTHTAVVQQGVAFCGGAISNDALSLFTCIHQEAEERSLRCLDPL